VYNLNKKKRASVFMQCLLDRFRDGSKRLKQFIAEDIERLLWIDLKAQTGY